MLAVAAALVLPSSAGVLIHYMDNPIHIAELQASAGETYRGWSDTAFCGYFLGGMHSPIWYGIMSAAVRLGMPAASVYGLFLLLGFIAPSLAVYWAGRRRGIPAGAAVIALTLALLPAVVVGAGSVFGGMWPFHLSIAFLVLLIDRLSRNESGPAHFAWIAALTGLALLTHLYIAVPLAIVLLGRVLLSVVRGAFRFRCLAGEFLAFVLGWIAACIYWGPFASVMTTTSYEPQNLSSSAALLRLVTPARVLDQLAGRGSVWDYWWQGFPLWILTGLVGLGLVRMNRRRDELPLYGLILTIAIIVMIVFIAGAWDVKWFGPFSWRLLSFAFAGMALAAFPGAVSLERAGRSRAIITAAIVLAVIQAAAVGISLRGVGPPRESAAMEPVRQLWRWLRENHTDRWGRVYLQDTFRLRRSQSGLSQSHVLALTSAETGVMQLGPSYGLPGQKSAMWTPSEFRTLFRRVVRGPEEIDYIKRLLWTANCTHLVTSDPHTSQVIYHQSGFETLFAADPFYVFAVGRPSQWLFADPPGRPAQLTSFETGRMVLSLRRAEQPTDVMIKVAYHPFWRIQSDIGGSLKQDDLGMLMLESVGAAGGTVRLEFAPPKWPLLVSLIAWGFIVFTGIRGARANVRSEPSDRACAEGPP